MGSRGWAPALAAFSAALGRRDLGPQAWWGRAILCDSLPRGLWMDERAEGGLNGNQSILVIAGTPSTSLTLPLPASGLAHLLLQCHREELGW